MGVAEVPTPRQLGALPEDIIQLWPVMTVAALREALSGLESPLDRAFELADVVEEGVAQPTGEVEDGSVAGSGEEAGEEPEPDTIEWTVSEDGDAGKQSEQ